MTRVYKLIMENWRRYLTEEQKTIPLGQCYPFANKKANEWYDQNLDMSKPVGKGRVSPDIDNKDKFKVVHGRITDKSSGESVLHAWVEMGDLVFDAQTSFTKPEGISKEVYYDMYQPEAHEEYTAEETMTSCMRTGQQGPWTEAIELDIEIGDIILGGKYKNKRMEVKEIGEDELGQPTINGKPILKFRMEKFLPDEKKSKKTLDAEKEKEE